MLRDRNAHLCFVGCIRFNPTVMDDICSDGRTVAALPVKIDNVVARTFDRCGNPQHHFLGLDHILNRTSPIGFEISFNSECHALSFEMSSD
ncbi:hypothetical protein AVEN_1804-1 [Araneus ventricosus]|uniref:Uncharacterized protein n=1 Tax=Araneus ventricosus TaxID=182803 RepID=A0A4Y2HYY3_ARAVE|nr:hypothetical protein AVEN_1804-1 [Araneus ventricosus]